MCKYGEPEEVVVCDNNNDRAYLLLHSNTTPINTKLTPSPLPTRSHRQRLRALQIRRLRPKSLRRAQLALVRRAAHLLRVIPRDGFPRSVL